VTALALVSLSGCLAPGWLGLDRPYDKNPFVAGYCMCYDAGVVVQGYPLPLLFGMGWHPGDGGWEVVTTAALPVAGDTSTRSATRSSDPRPTSFPFSSSSSRSWAACARSPNR